jgi:aminoglycoside phosphotransferase family enzyme/predicted kinase
VAARKSTEKTIDWTNPTEIEAVVQAISRCKKYRDEGGVVEFIQTHISSVLLTPRYVFKFKRPVDMGFVDFRTLKKRHLYCKEEMRLNRRLGKGVYLEVLPLWSVGDEFQFEPGEAVVDYAVVMNRLGSDRMLDHMVAAGSAGPREIEAVVRLIARFHRSIRKETELAHFGNLETITRNWEENFHQVVPYINITIKADRYNELQRAVFAYLTRNRALLEERAAGGFIRDGHGDLRSEHIYLGDPIKIIDSIEFSDRFRIGDVASDLAFLLMDLVARGRPDLSVHALDHYVELSGDRQMMRLIPFYACYRAFVRGKVLGFKLSDKHLQEAEQHRNLSRARAFFELAAQFAEQMAPPVLLVVAGLMGTGKSALAEAIGVEQGLPVLNSDRVRKELAGSEACGTPELPTRKMPYGEGIYSEAWNSLTYDTLFERAAQALQNGQSIILDASFSRRDMRSAAFDLARAFPMDAAKYIRSRNPPSSPSPTWTATIT